MQCQGRTRSGLRCRNRSLSGELFCDIHTRVNHSHNLALLIPLLLAILAGYFFFFGLLFNTAVFGVFDVNYLAFAGIEDLFLNMVRFGGTTLLLLCVLWVFYIITLFLVFVGILLIHMIRATRLGSLTLGQRLKLISLSMLVFILNCLMMVVIRFPARNRWHLNTLGRKREQFARSLFDLKETSGPVQQTKPILTSKEVFQDFLSFRNIGNHRFFISTLLLVLISVWMTYHAGGEAQIARACALHTGESAAHSSGAEPLPVPALILEQSCQQNGSETDETTSSLTGLFVSGLMNFYDFTPVTLQAADGEVKLLHLATTSRFDLFFNGASGRSLAVPRGAFSPNREPGFEESISRSVQAIEQQIKTLEDKVSASNQTLFGVSKDLQSTQEKLVILNQKPVAIHTSQKPSVPQPGATIPEHCWKKDPDYIIPYITSAYHIDNASILDALAKLSARYRSEPDTSAVITGYADPSGGYRLNQRLSDKRARAVSRLFEKLGVDRNRLFPVGMGENQSKQRPPRRVEIRSCRFQ